MGQNVSDLTSRAYHPKSREPSDRSKKHVTFPLSEQKLAYPTHTRELDEDEDDKRLVRPDRTVGSEEEDDKPLVSPASREKLVKEKRESITERKVPAQLRRRKGPPVWTHLPHRNKMSGNSRERSEEVWILDRNPESEALHGEAYEKKTCANVADYRGLILGTSGYD